MTKIKICGLTREEDAVFAAERGADFLGFIFIPTSPRHLEPERAAAIAAAVRAAREKPPKFVGVFRESSNDYIREVAALVGLDLVQLHGTESEEDIQELGLPAIKTMRVGAALPDTTAHPTAAWLLFDTFDERREGGTGRRFDWSLLAVYSRSKPFLLAGGLNADNVAAAISLVRPDGIDVASGVESEPGIKDHAKLERLIDRVKR
ncbi:MAG TPA: phosphoribosylanthranilate isomerase [Thermoanaerobaculia bacterium]|nr:phosphoribosylanthranilate isomerase [Thermoanaerobaculia bacterium]